MSYSMTQHIVPPEIRTSRDPVTGLTKLFVFINSCADPGIFFRGGGGGGGWGGPDPTQSGQRFIFVCFSVLNLFDSLQRRSRSFITGKSIFFKDPGGSNIFQGGGPTFSRGVQMLISIETHITCDFPGGGSGPPIPPPSGSAHEIYKSM